MSDSVLRAVALSGRDVADAARELEAVLQRKSSVLPVPPEPQAAATDASSAAAESRHALAAAMRVGEAAPPGTLVACTSGSTGTPKGALLDAANLRASAAASQEFLHHRWAVEPGPWLLALPAHHIAGINVIVRSVLAGFAPTATGHLSRGDSFSAAGFAADTRRLRRLHPERDLYTSLVPTQVASLVDSAEGMAALREYAAVLIGGSALRRDLAAQLDAQGVRYVVTYGSSETAGGMVYDGEALPGGTVRISDGGRVLLSGPMVAAGYRNVESPDLVAGRFLTSDVGEIRGGRLHILGRADGAINTGGLKVLPEEVEALVHHVDGVAECCAVGVPDRRWGEAVAVAIVLRPGFAGEDSPEAASDRVRDWLRDRLRAAGAPAHLIPHRVRVVAELPRTGPGKVDRQRVRQTFVGTGEPGMRGNR